MIEKLQKSDRRDLTARLSFYMLTAYLSRWLVASMQNTVHIVLIYLKILREKFPKTTLIYNPCDLCLIAPRRHSKWGCQLKNADGKFGKTRLPACPKPALHTLSKQPFSIFCVHTGKVNEWSIYQSREHAYQVLTSENKNARAGETAPKKTHGINS